MKIVIEDSNKSGFLTLDEGFVDHKNGPRVRYRCSECGYYHDIRKEKTRSFLKVMKYCNFCGVRFYCRKDRRTK